DEAEPAGVLEARRRFCDRRHAWELRRFFRPGHAERTQPAAADVRNCRGKIGQREIDLAADEASHRGSLALVGHRNAIDFRAVEETLRREMRLRADAGMA